MKITAIYTVLSLLAGSVLAAPAAVFIPGENDLEARGETHHVNLINRCGSGEAVFLYQEHPTPRGSGTINGPLKGGVAWLRNSKKGNCLSSGVNCGTVEFTLINPGSDKNNLENSSNYSLQSYGNHRWTYGMNFRFEGSCTKRAPGPCDRPDHCPGAFVGTNTVGGTPVNCRADNTGITITFC